MFGKTKQVETIDKTVDLGNLSNFFSTLGDYPNHFFNFAKKLDPLRFMLSGKSSD